MRPIRLCGQREVGEVTRIVEDWRTCGILDCQEWKWRRVAKRGVKYDITLCPGAHDTDGRNELKSAATPVFARWQEEGRTLRASLAYTLDECIGVVSGAVALRADVANGEPWALWCRLRWWRRPATNRAGN